MSAAGLSRDEELSLAEADAARLRQEVRRRDEALSIAFKTLADLEAAGSEASKTAIDAMREALKAPEPVDPIERWFRAMWSRITARLSSRK